MVELRPNQDYIPARGRGVIDTGLIIELPKGCYGRIAPKSGLALFKGIDVGAGVIDEDYRGVIKVILFNHSDQPFEVNKGDNQPFEVNKGDSVAQLICERILYPTTIEVKKMSTTERAAQGFGSSCPPR
ncbi:dUTPase [Popillia japonica]|uniref:Deoxyuridine 5'-triphosphate nucleotidohydrolase n=1 Tax=Popillia japonica TaxID=7064 RepID=A0AAW1LWE6_POPJA